MPDRLLQQQVRFPPQPDVRTLSAEHPLMQNCGRCRALVLCRHPILEAFTDKDALQPLFTAEFDFLPRIGEYLARDPEPGYFVHFNVVEVWHRQDAEGGAFRACIRLEVND